MFEDGGVTVTDAGDYWLFESTGLPDADIVAQFPMPGNPNEAIAQDWSNKIPKVPTPNPDDDPDCLPLEDIGDNFHSSIWL